MSAQKISKKLRDFSKRNNYRLVAFMAETHDGSKVEFSGCVTKADAKKVSTMAAKIIQ